ANLRVPCRLSSYLCDPLNTMVNGKVNTRLQVIVPITILSSHGPVIVDAMLDTGFEGLLTLTDHIISSLGLNFHSTGSAILADGVVVNTDRYHVNIEWDGSQHSILAYELGDFPLVRMPPLQGQRIIIDALPGGPVQIQTLGP